MNSNTKEALLIVLYVNALPYISRIYGGYEWVAQYFPAEGKVISGMLFFHAFWTLPAIPLMSSLRSKKKTPMTFMAAFAVTTFALVGIHAVYDLASDAQAAIGLIFIPIYISILTGAIVGLGGLLENSIRKKKEQKPN